MKVTDLGLKEKGEYIRRGELNETESLFKNAVDYFSYGCSNIRKRICNRENRCP